jgi:hypothetical protein
MSGFAGILLASRISQAVAEALDDPYWQQVGLLLRGEGTNGSTTIVDSSKYNYTLEHWQSSGATMVNNSTAQDKYGSGSVLFPAATTNSNGDMIIINKSATTITQPYARFGGVSNDWTVEMFYRPNEVGGGKTRGLFGYGFFAFNVALLNTGYIETAFSNTSAGTSTTSFTKVTTTSALTANNWYHLSWMRKGNVIYFFQDGVQMWTQAFTGTLRTFRTSDTYDFGLAIGLQHAGGPPGAISTGQTADGYMDDVRITHYARYATGGFTPPTEGAATNGGRGVRTLAAFGNAQTSTAQSQFGGSSYLGDGTGDYINVTDTTQELVNWYEGDYTIEYWIRPLTMSTMGYTNSSVTYPAAAGNQDTAGTTYWAFGPTSDGNVKFYYFTGSANFVTTSGVTIGINTWYHLAFVKNGTNLKIYVDGVERASATLSGTPQSAITVPFQIGSARGTTLASLHAHIDELRVSKTARYTSGFTPATTAFVNDADTVLLLHMDGTNGGTTFTDDNS